MEKITNVKLYEQVAKQVKNMILEGRYKTGDLIPSEKELMDATGVSRVTVREAIRSLADLGVLETKKGKGSIVLLDSQDLILQSDGKDQFIEYRKNFILSTETRLILEPELAKQAALIATDEDIKIMEESLNEKTSNENIDSQQDFHKAILNTLKNEILENVFDNLIQLEQSNYHIALIPPNKQERIKQEIDFQHLKILNAIKNRNSEFAYFYMKEHLLYLKETFNRYFDIFAE